MPLPPRDARAVAQLDAAERSSRRRRPELRARLAIALDGLAEPILSAGSGRTVSGDVDAPRSIGRARRLAACPQASARRRAARSARAPVARGRRDARCRIVLATLRDVAIVRVPTRQSSSRRVAVAAPAALAAELEGTRCRPRTLPRDAVDDLAGRCRGRAPRGGARSSALGPARAGSTAATLELDRAADRVRGRRSVVAAPSSPRRTSRSRCARSRVDGAVDVQALDAPGARARRRSARSGTRRTHTAAEVARLAGTVVGARASALLWERGRDGAARRTASYGLDGRCRRRSGRASLARRALSLRRVPSGRSGAELLAGALRHLGRAAARTAGGRRPPAPLRARTTSRRAEQLARLTTFGVRAAHALRSSAQRAGARRSSSSAPARCSPSSARRPLSSRSRTRSRRRSSGSPSCSASTASRSTSATTDDRCSSPPAAGSPGRTCRVAERLLELALGPARGRARGAHRRRDATTAAARGARRRARSRASTRRSPCRSSSATRSIGLLAVYPQRGRRPSENEASLLAALAGQLAVAVQNAQLHEQANELGAEREAALASEREHARGCSAHYEISRSFAQSLSLDDDARGARARRSSTCSTSTPR